MNTDSLTSRAHHPDEEGDALPFTLEEVLELVWVAEEVGDEETSHRAQHFRSAASPQMMAELERRGLAEAGPDGHHALTALGREKAEPIIRRHRLAERLVCDALHSDISKAEDSACVFEHIIVPDIADAICTLLGHPRLCPHGRPIPPGECCRTNASELSSVILRLPLLRVGQTARIAYLKGETSPRIQKLLSLGIAPGKMVELLQRWPVMIVRVENTQVALDQSVAESISVYAPSS